MEATSSNHNFSMLPLQYIVQFYIQLTVWACEHPRKKQPDTIRCKTHSMIAMPHTAPRLMSRAQPFFRPSHDLSHGSGPSFCLLHEAYNDRDA